MTHLPLPRIELLKTDRYMFGSMQISRGCPFTCEFCDIIVTFGRAPSAQDKRAGSRRARSISRQAGLKIVFVVDDNLIGNKKAIKPILRDIVQWQQERGYPLTLFTEASLDLAEDEELMKLMGLANFQSVFVGIESPNEESLLETKKLQNVRPNAGTLLERVRRIQQHGIDVWCGMIVGFDHDDASIFDADAQIHRRRAHRQCAYRPVACHPDDPALRAAETVGRLNDDEDTAIALAPTSFRFAMSREELARRIRGRDAEGCYTPTPISGASMRCSSTTSFKFAPHQLAYWRRHRLAWAKRGAGNYPNFRLSPYAFSSSVKDRALRSRYRRQLWRVFHARWREPHILLIYAIKIAMHYHYAAITRRLARRIEATVSMPDAIRSFSRAGRGQGVEAVS